MSKKVHITSILLNPSPIVGSPIKGTIFSSMAGATDFDVSLTITDGNIEVLPPQTITIASGAQDFTLNYTPTQVGTNYILKAIGAKPFLKYFDIRSNVAINSQWPISAGFIPITSVQAGDDGSVRLGNGKSYKVGIELFNQSENGYSVTLKLSFCWNGTGNVELKDIPAFIHLCNSMNSKHVTIDPYSTVTVESFSTNIDPKDYPDWTFSILAIPDVRDVKVDPSEPHFPQSANDRPIPEASIIH
jgi:hypothetical protein